MAKTNAERQKEYRQRNAAVAETVSNAPVSNEGRYASFEDYETNPGDYAVRENPGHLNWGDPMNYHELQVSEFKANRVTLPGDWDYVGVVV